MEGLITRIDISEIIEQLWRIQVGFDVARDNARFVYRIILYLDVVTNWFVSFGSKVTQCIKVEPQKLIIIHIKLFLSYLIKLVFDLQPSLLSYLFVPNAERGDKIPPPAYCEWWVHVTALIQLSAAALGGDTPNMNIFFQYRRPRHVFTSKTDLIKCGGYYATREFRWFTQPYRFIYVSHTTILAWRAYNRIKLKDLCDRFMCYFLCF